MINLLPYDYKQDVAYARRNTTLIKILLFLAVAAIGTLLLFGAGVLYSSAQIKSYDKELSKKKLEFQDKKIDQTYAQMEDISNNTKLALQVLSKEILFSKLITQIGKIIPSDTELIALRLEKDKIDGGITLEASAKDIQAATQLQINLQDKNNKVFEKVDIEKVSCTDTTERRYPCSATMRASFLKEKNPYTFLSINSNQTGVKK